MSSTLNPEAESFFPAHLAYYPPFFDSFPHLPPFISYYNPQCLSSIFYTTPPPPPPPLPLPSPSYLFQPTSSNFEDVIFPCCDPTCPPPFVHAQSMAMEVVGVGEVEGGVNNVDHHQHQETVEEDQVEDEVRDTTENRKVRWCYNRQNLEERKGRKNMRRSHKRKSKPISINRRLPTAQEQQQFAFRMGDPRTTVMIRNVPNMFTKENMLDLLDKHCLEENMKLAESVALGEAVPGARSEFDFFYLPMDFRTGHNLGYAFVNLTNPTATWKLCVAINGRRLDPLGSRKICEITFARIQGLAALIRHFNDTVFACERDEFLPVRFDPHRNGFCLFKEFKVGRRSAMAAGMLSHTSNQT